MPFLSPNQQCQSTERKNTTFHGLAYPKPTWGLPTLSLITNSSWLTWGGLPCLSSALWCQYPDKPYDTANSKRQETGKSQRKTADHRQPIRLHPPCWLVRRSAPSSCVSQTARRQSVASQTPPRASRAEREVQRRDGRCVRPPADRAAAATRLQTFLLPQSPAYVLHQQTFTPAESTGITVLMRGMANLPPR